MVDSRPVTSPVVLCLWVREGEWEVQVHGRHVPPGQRHVHVRRRRKRKGEYSWNVDGTRHDKNAFPVSEKELSAAKALAAKRLRVDPSILRLLTSTSGPCLVIVTSEHDAHTLPIVELRTLSGVVLLEAEEGLAIVELPEARRT